jgi:hypothetical protein
VTKYRECKTTGCHVGLDDPSFSDYCGHCYGLALDGMIKQAFKEGSARLKDHLPNYTNQSLAITIIRAMECNCKFKYGIGYVTCNRCKVLKKMRRSKP